MTNKEIISQLNSIDLSTYPFAEVYGLVSQFQPKFLRITLPVGCLIERIRPDINVFERKEVTYRPADQNKKPQRATLKNKTAFYGTICHFEEAWENMRYVALLEASKLYKQGLKAIGEENYTLSRWETCKPIRLAVFVNDDIYKDATHNRLLEMSKNEWRRGKSFIDEALQAEDYSQYVAAQFARPVYFDYEYIITATIADMLMYVNKCDGVMYPPVQAEGDYGMNIALRKDVADICLNLTSVREMKYVQKDGRGNLRFTKIGEAIETDMHGMLKWRYKEWRG